MKQKVIIPLIVILFTILIRFCCYPQLTQATPPVLFLHLSQYTIFQGNPVDLVPNEEFKKYELATSLFSDYAEKQRLIKIPKGYKLAITSDLLPYFPEGTMLVKTFFYYHDKRSPAKGKQLIETRILLKKNSQWNAGTYVWNAEQTDAVLLTKGISKSIDQVNENGEAESIRYHVPANRECTSCHNYDRKMMPIGFKARNLNRAVSRNNSTINQLNYFYNEGMLNAVNPSTISSLPASDNTAFSIEQRTRAYLDVNCAHCHNPKGSCSQSALSLSYEIPFEETNIANRKDRILHFFEKGRMPKLGTTVVDKEGLKLIRQYIKSL